MLYGTRGPVRGLNLFSGNMSGWHCHRHSMSNNIIGGARTRMRFWSRQIMNRWRRELYRILLWYGLERPVITSEIGNWFVFVLLGWRFVFGIIMK